MKHMLNAFLLDAVFVFVCVCVWMLCVRVLCVFGVCVFGHVWVFVNKCAFLLRDYWYTEPVKEKRLISLHTIFSEVFVQSVTVTVCGLLLFFFWGGGKGVYVHNVNNFLEK